MVNKTSTFLENGLLLGKLVHLAIPVRWSMVAEGGRGPIETACTYDVHPRGARLLGTGEVNTGDVILIERGRNKAMCRVMWVADPHSHLRGQFTVQCVEEGRTPWDDELRQMEEQYQPVIYEEKSSSRVLSTARRGDENRRRRPRYAAEGKADVLDGLRSIEGDVLQLSEGGARIGAKSPLLPGTDFRLQLSIFDVSVALKAQVKYVTATAGMGVEFQEIRRGDRPLLNYVLRKLGGRKADEFAPVEAAAKPLVATAG